MSDSNPIKQDPDAQTHRLCDFCSESPALLYCRADSAKLCLSCDREVHSTNELFKKHTRLILCESCFSAPASVFCSTHNSVLCQNCDWEIHTSSSSGHDRRPLEGFSGCPSVTEILGVFGFEDIGKKSLLGGEGIVNSDLSGSDYGFDDFLVWDTPSFISLDDLIVSSGSHHNFQAMGVPPLPKNRNAICGQHKAEMLNQLRELAKLEPNSDDGGDDVAEKPQHASYPDFEPSLKRRANLPRYELQSNSYRWCTDPVEVGDGEGTYNENNRLVPEKDSDNLGNNINTNINNNDNGGLIRSWNDVVANESIQVPKVRELTPQERDTAISRYKEKKKNRRYDKHVRYESRKVRAESRTRIKGRFAKVD
jgi:hypothetical protein